MIKAPIVASLLAVGCAATPVPVRVVDAVAFENAARGRDVVVACTFARNVIQANYGVGEPAPFVSVRPKRGYLSRVSFHVDGVRRGSYDTPELVIEHARAVTEGDAAAGLTTFAPGDDRRVWIAFDRDWRGGRHGYLLAPRGDE